MASGATARTSTRIERELPMGTRTMEPRSVAEALNLVGRFEVRIEPPIGIHARVQDQAEIQGMGQDAVDELPAELRKLSPGPSRPRTDWSCPCEIETLVCMPLPFTPTTGLGRKLAV